MTDGGGRRLKAQRVLFEEFREPPGVADTFWNDPLATIKTSTDAKAYVAGILRVCTDADFESFVRLYHGQSVVQGGAGKIRPIPLDDRVEELLDAIDSHHDFGPDVLKVLDPPIPKKFPSNWDDDVAVLDFLGKTPSFSFKNKRCVPNPMAGAHLWKSFDYPNDEADVHRLVARHDQSIRMQWSRRDTRILPVDIPFTKGAYVTDRKILRFQTIVTLCRSMKEWFGPHQGFLLDGGDVPIMQLVTGLFEIHNALKLGFVMHAKWAKLKKAVRDEVETVPGTAWERVATDANVFDAPDLAQRVNFDPRPTGRVNSTVTLLGGKNGLSIDVELAVHGRLHLTKEDCEGYSSKYAVRAAWNAFKRGDEAMSGFSIQQWLDLKRAGDRGQVLHALQYDQVVVTGDRYMAMHAFAVGAKFIYVRRSRPLLRDHPYHRIYTLVLGRGTASRKAN